MIWALKISKEARQLYLSVNGITFSWGVFRDGYVDIWIHIHIGGYNRPVYTPDIWWRFSPSGACYLVNMYTVVRASQIKVIYCRSTVLKVLKNIHHEEKIATQTWLYVYILIRIRHPHHLAVVLSTITWDSLWNEYEYPSIKILNDQRQWNSVFLANHTRSDEFQNACLNPDNNKGNKLRCIQVMFSIDYGRNVIRTVMNSFNTLVFTHLFSTDTRFHSSVSKQTFHWHLLQY